MKSALTTGAVIALVACLAIALSIANTKEGTAREILVAIFAAILQTAALGLIYEVWLRDEIERRSLQRHRLSIEIAGNDLVSLSSNPAVDWHELAAGQRVVTVVAADPRQLLGPGWGSVFDHATSSSLERLNVAIPDPIWDSTDEWRKQLKEAWQTTPKGASVMFQKVNTPSYDLVANDEVVILLLPAGGAVSSHGAASRRLVFKRGGKGVSDWATNQVVAVEQHGDSDGFAHEGPFSEHSRSDPTETGPSAGGAKEQVS